MITTLYFIIGALVIFGVGAVLALKSSRRDNLYLVSLVEDERRAASNATLEVTTLRADLKQARKGLQSVADLVGSSNYVGGLHLNGDAAPWDDLRSGGKYEEWLCDFDEALHAIPQQKTIELSSGPTPEQVKYREQTGINQ